MGGEPVSLRSVVLRGHGVASGAAEDTPHPADTISLQAPFFTEGGLDLTGSHPATLNLSTAPRRILIVNPAFHFPDVRWTDLHDPESSDIIDVWLRWEGRRVHAWGYRPTPEWKADHPQPEAVLEVIAPFLPGIGPGTVVELELDPAQVEVREA